MYGSLIGLTFDWLSHATALDKLGIHLFSKLQNKNEINHVYCLERWGHFRVVCSSIHVHL